VRGMMKLLVRLARLRVFAGIVSGALVFVLPATAPALDPMPPAPPVEPSYPLPQSDPAHYLLDQIQQHFPPREIIERYCKRTSPISVKCHVLWRNAKFYFHGTLRITDDGSVRSIFSGSRARIDCLRERSTRACSKPLTWG
jgi:hypothetical protein